MTKPRGLRKGDRFKVKGDKRSFVAVFVNKFGAWFWANGVLTWRERKHLRALPRRAKR